MAGRKLDAAPDRRHRQPKEHIRADDLGYTNTLALQKVARET
jgi:hypothetical protein